VVESERRPRRDWPGGGGGRSGVTDDDANEASRFVVVA
jgi:hypothetical protein